MNFVKESKVAEVEEKKRNKNFEIKLFLWIGIPLFIILLYFAITIDLSLIESL
jgi:nitrate reductase NapE component